MVATKCSCGKTYQLADELAGKKVRCKNCQSTFLVPFPDNLPVAVALDEPAPSSPPSAISAETPIKKKKKKKLKITREDYEFLAGDDLLGRISPSKEKVRSHQIGAAFRYLGLGVLFIVVAVALFWFFSSLEEHGGVVRIHWAIALIYNLGGKWLCLILFGLLGGMMTLLSILNFVGVSAAVNED
jgi:hypothetical protein